MLQNLKNSINVDSGGQSFEISRKFLLKKGFVAEIHGRLGPGTDWSELVSDLFILLVVVRSEIF